MNPGEATITITTASATPDAKITVAQEGEPLPDNPRVIQGTAASIEVSSDGEHWTEIGGPAGFVASGAFSVRWPDFQIAAIQAIELEELRARVRALVFDVGQGIISGYALGIKTTWFNRGVFEAACGMHTRQAMRSRKIRRYVQEARSITDR